MSAEPNTPDRSRPDACPGALQVHQAADGALARVRLPGGYLEPGQLQALAEASRELAAGELELTSRGNLQLRAVTDPSRFAELLAEIGLLPSATHERVRNILASPLSGRIGGLVDVRDLVRELDHGLCADPMLARLPGRVMFSLDDGRGDVSGLSADLGLHAVGPDEVTLVLAGRDSGARIPSVDGVPVLLEAARHLLAIRGDEWRLHEIEDGPERILAGLGLRAGAEPADLAADEAGPIGWLDHGDGSVTLAAGLALGTIPARTAEFLAAVDKPLVVTPWRSVLLCDLDEWTAEQVVRVLAPMGLIFDAGSPWLQVSACTGSPGCAKSLADVRGDLGAAVAAGELPVEGRQHWVGCDRKCGRPKGEVVDVVATGDGYRVDRRPR
ncbi:precorrin-3B synthase [Rhodococcus maanshanensis]|uniref:precorrin-3B synthase n=1 Tax=Rhodococcus maanshanensis TaxID=183556 RepID=UPI00093529B1|nr:precorrin-3B synthase [Rhodococcus maanshanensis]